MMSGDLIVSNAFNEGGSSQGENIIQVYCVSEQKVIHETRWNWYRKMITANMWNGNIVCTPDSNSSRMFTINAGTIEPGFSEGNEPFLVESTVYREVYVFGDYVYYTLADTGTYFNRPIYRIKIDGTDWSQFE